MKTLKTLLVGCSMIPEKFPYVKYSIIALFLISCQNVSSQTNDGTTVIDSTIVQQIVDKITAENQEANPESKKVKKDETKDYVNLNADYGYGIRSNYYFSKLKAEHIFGDLNKDGLEDAVINVVSSHGGNSEYRHLYLFLSEDGSLKLKSISETHDLGDCAKGGFYPEKIETGMLVGKSKCFAENDPRCCPSIVHKTTVKLENDQLVTVSK